MKKHKLTVEDEFDFELIGICSNHSDYRLSWNINQCLKISLKKGEDYVLNSKKEGESAHSFYQFIDEDNQLEIYLLKNTASNYRLLIPEQDQIDFFLILKNNFEQDLESVLSKLKENESVLTAFTFEPESLKSKANLLF